jgi:LPS sulfotransferase NodH
VPNIGARAKRTPKPRVSRVVRQDAAKTTSAVDVSPVRSKIAFYKVSSAHQGLDFPRFVGEPLKYVVATQPRTGSHYLCQTLYSTGMAGCPLEYFHPRHWGEWMARCKSNDAKYVLSLLIQRRSSQNGSFGMKLHWSQLRAFLALGIEGRFRDAKFIYLTRDDVLGQAISLVMAQRSGQWVRGQPMQKEPMYSYEAIRKSIGKILDERKRWETFFCQTGIEPLRIVYESFVADPRFQTERILRFVGPYAAADLEGCPAAVTEVQRTDLNEQWRKRFQDAIRNKYDERSLWLSMVDEK